MRLSIRLVSLLTGCILLLPLTWSVARGAGLSTATRPSYSQVKVAHCLVRQGVIRGSLPAATKTMSRVYPPGITGTVLFFAGFGPKIDRGGLYFFRTSQLAQTGEAKLVAALIFGRGLPPALRAAVLSQKPPSSAAADDLHHVSGNVVVLWDYPRRHPALSDRIVSACLAASVSPS